MSLTVTDPHALVGKLLEAEARAERAETALAKIAEGKVPPDRHGHYLAHREAVAIARAALKTT